MCAREGRERRRREGEQKGLSGGRGEGGREVYWGKGAEKLGTGDGGGAMKRDEVGKWVVQKHTLIGGESLSTKLSRRQDLCLRDAKELQFRSR